MIEVSVGNEHQVNGREILNLQAGPAQAFQHKQPAGKIGINDDVLAADLQEETGMADESQPQLTVESQLRFVGLASAGSDGGVPHQTAKLARALAQCRIVDRVL